MSHRNLQEALEQAALRGPGHTAPALRQAVASGKGIPPDLEAFVRKVEKQAYRVTDEDIATLGSQYSEDEIFEIVVAASVGAAAERLRAALRALEEA